MSDNDNIVPFGQVKGGKDDGNETKLPENEYRIVDNNGHEYYAYGFLVFTTQHVAVMRDNGKGAIPVIVMPLSNVWVAEMVDDEDELPF